MEPRPNRRGNHEIPANYRGGRKLQWSHVLTDVETPPVRSRSLTCPSLQWSHVLTDVETILAPQPADLVLPASMEPRPNRRGNVRTLCPVVRPYASMEPRPNNVKRPWIRPVSRTSISSMEPRPNRRGNPPCLSPLSTMIRGFKWSHVLKTWKRPDTGGSESTIYRLQWSHVLTDVETTRTPGSDPPIYRLQWSHVQQTWKQSTLIGWSRRNFKLKWSQAS